MAEPPPPFDTEEAKQLHKLYADINLHKNNEMKCDHFVACAKSCEWDNRKLLPPTGGYVGSDYALNRILFVGINANRGVADGGQFYDCYDWLSRELTPSSRSIDGVIHRFLQIYFGTKLEPIEARKRFAFTNLIKCSATIRAAEPTQVMHDNCRIRLGTLFQEIDILQPRYIVCVGEPPFKAILWHYMADVDYDDSELKLLRFTISRLSGTIKVIRLCNPPQGYRTVRIFQKKLNSGEQLAGAWGEVARNCASTIAAFRSESKLVDSTKHWIDPAGYLYQACVELLISFLKTTSPN